MWDSFVSGIVSSFFEKVSSNFLFRKDKEVSNVTVNVFTASNSGNLKESIKPVPHISGIGKSQDSHLNSIENGFTTPIPVEIERSIKPVPHISGIGKSQDSPLNSIENGFTTPIPVEIEGSIKPVPHISGVGRSQDSPLNSIENGFTTPNPVEIEESIKSAPPFQQVQKATNYIGLKVCWELEYRSIQCRENDLYTVLLNCVESSGPIIVLDVDIKSYPQFKIIHKGAKILVKGEIGSAETYAICLKNIESLCFF